MVYFSYNSKIEEREGDIDSDPLIRQARSAIVGEVPKAPIGYTSSVTCAAKISTTLRCRAIGIWASDQGDGIGGGALLQNGSIIECHSAAGVKELDAIKKIRELEDDEDEEVDRLIDQLEEACEGKYWHFKDGSTRAVNGEIDDVFTVYLASFGLDSEICLEVYDDIISGNCPDSVTRVVHSISRDL
jgi:hypothetical protein